MSDSNVSKIINAYMDVGVIPVDGIIVSDFGNVSKQDSSLVVYIPNTKKESFIGLLKKVFPNYVEHLEEVVSQDEKLLADFALKFTDGESYSDYLLKKYGELDSILDFYGIDNYAPVDKPNNIEEDFFLEGIGDDKSVDYSFVDEDEICKDSDKNELEDDYIKEVEVEENDSDSDSLEENIDDLFGETISSNDCNSCYSNEEEIINEELHTRIPKAVIEDNPVKSFESHNLLVSELEVASSIETEKVETKIVDTNKNLDKIEVNPTKEVKENVVNVVYTENTAPSFSKDDILKLSLVIAKIEQLGNLNKDLYSRFEIAKNYFDRGQYNLSESLLTTIIEEGFYNE